MGEVKAQLDVLESCASALSNEGTSAAPAADALGADHPGASSAGTTPASVGLISALAKATEHWRSELTEGTRLLGALGSAIDHDAVALRNLDNQNADHIGTAPSTEV
jgi:hypothetical protein